MDFALHSRSSLSAAAVLANKSFETRSCVWGVCKLHGEEASALIAAGSITAGRLPGGFCWDSYGRMKERGLTTLQLVTDMRYTYLPASSEMTGDLPHPRLTRVASCHSTIVTRLVTCLLLSPILRVDLISLFFFDAVSIMISLTFCTENIATDQHSAQSCRADGGTGIFLIISSPVSKRPIGLLISEYVTTAWLGKLRISTWYSHLPPP